MQMIADPDPAVTAIIVTLDSDVDEISENLAECSACMQVVICDNSEDVRRSAAIREFAKSQRFSYLSMGENRGIGYAQNRGIELADKAGAEFVLLLDDDSRLSCTALSDLLKAYCVLKAQGDPVGAVCGHPVDRYNNEEGGRGSDAGPFTSCREMMSSGSLIPLSVLRNVGLMDESLFVDYVDFEWGWRAIAQGYRLYLANHVTFSHALGEGIETVAGIKIKLKSPIRHYYQTRNALRLLRRPYVPMGWRLKNLALTLTKCAAFPMLVRPRSSRLSYALRGLWDGLWGDGIGRYHKR